MLEMTDWIVCCCMVPDVSVVFVCVIRMELLKVNVILLKSNTNSLITVRDANIFLVSVLPVKSCFMMYRNTKNEGTIYF